MKRVCVDGLNSPEDDDDLAGGLGGALGGGDGGVPAREGSLELAEGPLQVAVHDHPLEVARCEAVLQLHLPRDKSQCDRSVGGSIGVEVVRREASGAIKSRNKHTLELATRTAIFSLVSVPRPSSRAWSASTEGGAMKTKCAGLPDALTFLHPLE